MSLPPRLGKIVATLLVKSERSRNVSIDAIGEAFGVSAASSTDVDLVMTALEAKGRKVTAPTGGDGPDRLREVLAAAKELQTELARVPRADEIAERAGMPTDRVWRALAFAKVLGRGTAAR
jgi:hypothetical protein